MSPARFLSLSKPRCRGAVSEYKYLILQSACRKPDVTQSLQRLKRSGKSMSLKVGIQSCQVPKREGKEAGERTKMRDLGKNGPSRLNRIDI